MPINHADDLYGLPIEEFTAARNELAERLKREGGAEEAKRVKALKKPSVALWGVNQLARQHPEGIYELLELRSSIEEASNASELRSLTEQRRKVLTRLVSQGRKVLEEGGHAPSAATVERISQMLIAAGEEDTRERFASGMLESEPVSTTSNFGAFGSFDASTVTFEDEPDEPDPRLERLRAEADEAEREASELEAAALEAEAAASAARDRAVEAKRTALKAREKAERAED